MNPLRFAACNLFAAIVAAFVLVYCGGCAPIPPAHLPPDDARAVDAFGRAWSEAGLPALSGCHVEHTRVVHTTTAEDFERRCGAPVSFAAACLSREPHRQGLRVVGVPVVVLRSGQPSVDSHGGGPVVHELAHWAGSCAGLGVDNGHRDARRWLGASKDPAVRAASVQGRAARLLGY